MSTKTVWCDVKKSIPLSIYIGLTSISFLFLNSSFKNFLEKKTYFHTTEEAIGAMDIPTLTVCFEITSDLSFEYGTNFTIRMGYNDSNDFGEENAMKEGDNEITDLTGKTVHVFVKEMTVQQIRSYGEDRLCYKISPVDLNLEPKGLELQYELLFSSETDAPVNAKLYVTSEENAYGAVFEKWFDGDLDPFTLKKDKFHDLAVSEIRKIHHLPHHCQSEQSYYQCLASKLEQNSTSKNESCSYLTLPSSTKLKDMLQCNTTEHKSMGLILMHLSEEICKKDADKMCVVTEYSIKESRQYLYEVDNEEPFGFKLEISAPESPSYGHRLNKPYKRVFTETLVMDELQLIGTAGGTLGLMIGFSFWTCMEWIKTVISALLSKLSKHAGTNYKDRIKEKQLTIRGSPKESKWATIRDL